jgi:hypothetical protein
MLGAPAGTMGSPALDTWHTVKAVAEFFAG